jgi:hypothetical protein
MSVGLIFSLIRAGLGDAQEAIASGQRNVLPISLPKSAEKQILWRF